MRKRIAKVIKNVLFEQCRMSGCALSVFAFGPAMFEHLVFDHSPMRDPNLTPKNL